MLKGLCTHFYVSLAFLLSKFEQLEMKLKQQKINVLSVEWVFHENLALASYNSELAILHI